ncbi:MAG: hypothetical protein JRH11_18120 [Deltaproteobacteria bacterium]|nr:hypothetical protein [Deltaproteobacteria bacterium]
MAFRDANEALRHRVEGLERELEEEREAHAQTRQVLEQKEGEVADVRSGREDSRKQTEREQRRRARARWRSETADTFGRPAIIGGLVLLFLGVGVVLFFNEGPVTNDEYTNQRGLPPFAQEAADE